MTVEAKGRMTLLVNDYRKNPLLDAWMCAGQTMNVTKPIKASGIYRWDDIYDAPVLKSQITLKNGVPSLRLIKDDSDTCLVGSPGLKEFKWTQTPTSWSVEGLWTDPAVGLDVPFKATVNKKA